MNIDLLLEKHCENKIGNPSSVVKICDVSTDILDSVRSSISSIYNLESEEFETKEFVFAGSRRIVLHSPLFKTTKQLYTSIDFDYKLGNIVSPLVESITDTIGKDYIPTLMQLATLLPGQKLKWHIDTFLYQQFSNKIHIPLNTNDLSYYESFNGENLEKDHLSFGSAWNINNLILHRSTNLGQTSRTHLIVDFIRKDKLEILEAEKINYFHHRLDSMSAKEKLQIEQLIEFSKKPV